MIGPPYTLVLIVSTACSSLTSANIGLLSIAATVPGLLIASLGLHLKSALEYS